MPSRTRVDTTFLGLCMLLGGKGYPLPDPSMRQSPPQPSPFAAWSPLGGNQDGFCESARHLTVVSWVAAEGDIFIRKTG